MKKIFINVKNNLIKRLLKFNNRYIAMEFEYKNHSFIINKRKNGYYDFCILNSLDLKNKISKDDKIYKMVNSCYSENCLRNLFLKLQKDKKVKIISYTPFINSIKFNGVIKK